MKQGRQLFISLALSLILVIPVLADGEMPTPKLPVEPTPTPRIAEVYEQPVIVAEDQATYYEPAISVGFDIAQGVLSLLF